MAAAEKKAVLIQQSGELLRVLKGLSYKVLEARDGLDGVRKILRHQPEVVFLGMDAPVLNGINIAKLLDLLQVRIPLIFISSREAHKEEALALEATASWLHTSQVTSQLPGVLEWLRPPRFMRKNFHCYFKQHEWANLLAFSGRKKILVVEDSRLMRHFELKTLDATGQYTLFSAENGLDAILKALMVEPDLIVSDVQMEVMDGLTMSQVLYVLGKAYPITFLTEHEEAGLFDKARSLDGVVGFMLKKDLRDEKTLAASIEKQLGLADMARESSRVSYQSGSLKHLLDSGPSSGLLAAGQTP